MKNKDLIAELQKFDPDDRVSFNGETEFEVIRASENLGRYHVLVCTQGKNPLRMSVFGRKGGEIEPAASRMRCV